MLKMEDIQSEIRDIMRDDLNPVGISLLVKLLYIKEHFPELTDGGEADETKLLAWVDRMENADGTTGPHWSRHEAEVIQTKYGISCGELEFYTALNMMYSDYCVAIGQSGAATVELYARMAAAFLNDKDAQPDKLSRYYQYIARHS